MITPYQKAFLKTLKAKIKSLELENKQLKTKNSLESLILIKINDELINFLEDLEDERKTIIKDIL